MQRRRLVFWLILSVYWCQGSTTERDSQENKNNNPPSILSDPSRSTCSADDYACLSLANSDKLGLEAIRALHQKLDDDANGNVDLAESDDFLREELKYDSGYEKRQQVFHSNDDTHISLKELWDAWLKSEVHNWTTEQTTEWLTVSIELPQYVPAFISNKVKGATLPRLAANNPNYLNQLGIKDPIHKQKIVLKAMDVVLFGPPKGIGSQNSCNIGDYACLEMAQNDKLGLEAIKTLHQQLDDDADGDVDLSESDDFLREELKYDSGYEKRQNAFHKNDMHISVKELWEAWRKSEVHNWTVDQTTDWLINNVQLPQYAPVFLKYKVTGAILPRLAANNPIFLSQLGIKDPIHKQKIVLKAMDVVLFGPPKDGQPHWKDFTLIVLLIGGSIGVWYAFNQNKKFKNHLNRMNRDMDSLQNAEKALENLQKELEQAKQVQETVISEKKNLEKKLEDSKGDLSSLSGAYSDVEVSQLKAEIEMLRTELQIAGEELKDRCWSPPAGLQQWLQLTHEVENKSYLKKRLSAEKQLQQAREACEKLRKKRSSLVGAFVSTHGKSIDEVDRSIVEARTALNEVTQELQERVYRWKQIELMCGFNIINNNGLQFLETALYRNGNSARGLNYKGRMNSQDDLDDDTGSLYGGNLGHPEANAQSWREGDSSGSEVSRQEEESHGENRQGVHFMVGSEVSVWPEESTKHGKLSFNPRSTSNSNMPVSKPVAPMTRSFSQDTNVSPAESVKPKTSHSDTSLNSPAKPARPLRQSTIKEQPSGAVEDDVCSTDSSLMDDDVKKKKKKLFLFSKKSKAKRDC